MKALGQVVSEKKIFSCIFHHKPMSDNDAPPGGGGGSCMDPRGTGPCGFGEEDFLCFSHDTPGVGPV